MPYCFYLIYRIHWGGTETATHWCGYMSGAVQSGQRVALEVLAELCPTALIQEDLETLKSCQITNRPARHTESSKPPYLHAGKAVLLITLAVGTAVLLARGQNPSKIKNYLMIMFFWGLGVRCFCTGTHREKKKGTLFYTVNVKLTTFIPSVTSWNFDWASMLWALGLGSNQFIREKMELS